MVPTVSLKPVLRALLLGGALSLLAGCSIFGGKDDETNNANKDAANYRERTVEQIYADGWRAINAGAWDVCAAQFNEVDRQHPYSVWARRAMLISAFCSYQSNAYAQAIATAAIKRLVSNACARKNKSGHSSQRNARNEQCAISA